VSIVNPVALVDATMPSMPVSLPLLAFDGWEAIVRAERLKVGVMEYAGKLG